MMATIGTPRSHKAMLRIGEDPPWLEPLLETPLANHSWGSPSGEHPGRDVVIAVMGTSLSRIPSRQKTSQKRGDCAKTSENGSLPSPLDCSLRVRVGLIDALFCFRLREPCALDHELNQGLLTRRI
jgi:hypothetical protein